MDLISNIPRNATQKVMGRYEKPLLEAIMHMCEPVKTIFCCVR